MDSNKKSFDNLNLPKELLRGIYSMGWEYPSDIQHRAIPEIMKKQDIIIQAQSGMGKTGCFCIALLANLDMSSDSVQSIILCHSRELANQTYTVLNELSQFMNVNTMLYIGGSSNEPKSSVKSRMYPTIFVGTPGKLKDVFENNLFTKQKINIKYLIIDEFDQLFQTKFRDSIKPIVSKLTLSGQIILCSATISNEISDFINKSILSKDNPHIEIRIDNSEVALDGIDQFNVKIDAGENNGFYKDLSAVKKYKYLTIIDLLDMLSVGQVIIFVNTINDAKYLKSMFKKDNYPVAIIYGDLLQKERNEIIRDFKENKYRILIATNIISRGFDVHTVSLVINYDLPINSEEYIHRIGRTGRYGKKGISISLIGSEKELANMRELEKIYSIKICDLPDNVKLLQSTY